MKQAVIPKSINLALWSIMVLTTVFLLIGLPLISGHHPLFMAILIILLIPVNTPFWSLLHEAIHRNLHPHKKINEFMGRFMSVIFGASFQILRFGHMMHHQYNREWESEIYSPAQNKFMFALNHYFKMLGGLYITEVLMSFVIALAPAKYARKVAHMIFSDSRHQQAVIQMLLKPESVAKIRMDCAAILALYAACFHLYGTHWELLALLIAGRALVISLMDNAYHYGTPADNSVPAHELETSPLISKLILNFNYHMTHHKNAGLPWNQLAEAHKEQNIPFSKGLTPALFAQFKGPIMAEDI